MLSSMQPIVEPRGRSAYKGNLLAAALLFQEGQQVCVNSIGLCRGHAVRKTYKGFPHGMPTTETDSIKLTPTC